VRRRLTLTVVGLVIGTLLLAGGGALVVASVTARQHAVAQLVGQGEALARNASAVRSRATLRVVGRVLRLDRAVIVVVGPSGRIVATVPRDAPVPGQLVLPATGAPRSGIDGDTAYAVVPAALGVVTGPLPPRDRAAVLLVRRVGALFPDWRFFVVVVAATAAVAAAVAAGLSRRIARPLLAASAVTGRIAAGDLDARLVAAGTPGDELDSLARSINTMATSLQQARRRETELLASVSHDLRTPLTSIRGYAEAIADGVATDPRRAAAIITEQATRLERLVGDLLDLAKVRARRLRLHLEAVELLGVVDQATDTVAPDARRRGVLLTRRSEGAGPSARADADRLAQVLTNLLENAVAHASSTVSVDVGRVAARDRVWVAVLDDGPGIPAVEIDRVFDRFYQVDRGPAARTGGSGLGLSIVAELVAAMGGEIRAESPVSPDPGRPGTRFVLTLPAASPQARGADGAGRPAGGAPAARAPT